MAFHDPMALYRTLFVVLSIGCFAVSGCGKKQVPAAPEQTPKQEDSRALVPSENAASGGSGALVLPAGFGKRTGDLDEMVKERSIRALVIVNPIGFFYQAGRPQGIQYEALQEFEKFINEKENTGKLPVKVVFLPMRPDQLESALTQGLGDIIAQGIVITPEREQRVAFSVPIQKDVAQVVVTGPALANVSSFDDLAGKSIYVNPLTTYYDNLKKVSDAQQKAGKQPLTIKAADNNLFDDDLIEMVNAGLIPATVTIKPRADLWAQVLPNIKSHPELVVASGLDIGWVMRKNNPQLKQAVDEFAQTHVVGTSFGNTLLRRYLQNTKWITNSTSAEELQKFNSYIEFFKKYAAEYNFDYLMLAAQGYQESLFDQDKKSHVGAVGVMQVIPKLAAANPIDIPNVGNADGNIHAGVKMLRNIADTYFNDPGIDPLNKTLFVFASYNAGPNRIVRLRKKAQDDGLDPNKWFGNVELEVAKEVGQETVTYVGNIYKYYVAYKLTSEQKQQQPQAPATK
ncbi:lytic transglycosylase F [Alloacidobacterium dinghuense]|uniref:Lytic transglycosylase F n=1 Tax=Alloacidobacterium dinghuense TaxID=2763107 RepID=A0A7G8BLF3_9BACT|nr:lytic transglycosylase F [Alloacidobacterium dinghuense]QNI33373.1 lytic transglycosylase F [Alloacidobacterium dinghuense]